MDFKVGEIIDVSKKRKKKIRGSVNFTESETFFNKFDEQNRFMKNS